MPSVRASAIVDKIDSGPVPTWEVTVWGEPPHDHRRTYTLQVKTDTLAAQEGIRLFVEEMENLDSLDKG
jgi:hypothetical protein